MRALRTAVMRMAYGFGRRHPAAAGRRRRPQRLRRARPRWCARCDWEGGTRLVEPTAAAALATLARDAVDLFGGRLAARIRVCAAEDCGLLFVDASRPGRRRWCSMERCGNLAKVRGHRARRAD